MSGIEEKYLDKVRKLLAKAESTDSEAEAEALNEHAAKLIAQYGIDQALLAEDGKIADVIESRRIKVDAPYAVDKCSLLHLIAKPLRVQTVRTNAGRRRSDGYVMVLIGYQSDLDRVDVLYTSLLVQAARELVRVRPDYGWENVAAYRRSWFAGFTGAVYRRLKDAEERAAAVPVPEQRSGSRSTELVLIDRKAQVALAVKKEFPRLVSGSSRSLSGSGAAAGRAAGERADLGGTRISQNRRSLR